MLVGLFLWSVSYLDSKEKKKLQMQYKQDQQALRNQVMDLKKTMKGQRKAKIEHKKSKKAEKKAKKKKKKARY